MYIENRPVSQQLERDNTDTSDKRILLTGTFCSLNKGDAAMRIALISLLRSVFPSSQITVMTPYPELDSSVYASDVIVLCSRRKPSKAAQMILRSLIWNFAYRFFGKDIHVILDKEARVYRQSDIVVDLSGDGLTEEYGLRCLISHLVPIILAKLLLKPVFVCAQTIGPLRRTGFICGKLLSKVDQITAREKLTQEYLSSLGLNGSVKLAADLAFLMEPVSKERARVILASEGVPQDKPLIGFSVSCLPGNVRGNRKCSVPAHYQRAIAEALDTAVDMGLQPVIVSHSTGPGGRYDDRRAAVSVCELTSDPSRIIVLKGDYSPEETKGIISQMELFVGVRLHSCIAAMSTGVPVVCIAYGPKAYGIMNLAGQGRWVADISKVTGTQLSSMVRKAWEERELTRDILVREMVEVRALAQTNVEIIKQLLDENAGFK